MMMNKFAMLHGKPNPLVSVSSHVIIAAIRECTLDVYENLIKLISLFRTCFANTMLWHAPPHLSSTAKPLSSYTTAMSSSSWLKFQKAVPTLKGTLAPQTTKARFTHSCPSLLKVHSLPRTSSWGCSSTPRLTSFNSTLWHSAELKHLTSPSTKSSPSLSTTTGVQRPGDHGSNKTSA